MSNEVQNNICRSQTIERLSDRLLDYEFPNWVRVEYWGTGAPIKNFEREGAVYIEKLEDFKWSVSFCGLKYQLGSASPREVSGNFQVED